MRTTVSAVDANAGLMDVTAGAMDLNHKCGESEAG